MQRRLAISHVATLASALAAPWLAGCAGEPSAAPPSNAALRDERLLTLTRTLPGGFLAPPTPVIGVPARPGTGMFVKWVAPTALALRGPDLLVLDAAVGRLWRADATLNTVTGIAGAPTGDRIAVALGADLSAWVLDPPARQVLRFARDGRLMQTFRSDAIAAGPSALALADGGLTLLVADSASASWSEQRAGSAPVLRVAPTHGGGQRISGVDGLAIGRADRNDVWVLDRLAGAVHRVTRDGRVVESRGRGVLKQPQSIAVDRFDRVWVLDAIEQALIGLSTSEPPLRLTNTQLRVQQIGGMAIDEDQLAISDRLVGQVLLYRLGRPGTVGALP